MKTTIFVKLGDKLGSTAAWVSGMTGLDNLGSIKIIRAEKTFALHKPAQKKFFFLEFFFFLKKALDELYLII